MSELAMSDSESMLDAIVIGAGIMGSCTAYQIAKAGRSVLLLEQFSLGHAKGSSHGASRIVRFAHTDAVHVPLAKKTYTEWEELERLAGERLLNKCGLVWLSTPEGTEAKARILREFGLRHAVFSGSELGARFPHLTYDDSWHALFDPAGGLVHADRALRAAQSQIIAHGGQIRANEPVLRFDAHTDCVEVFTPLAKHVARKLIITAGPWLRQLLPNLPIQTSPELIGLTFWRIRQHSERFQPDQGSPVMIMSDKCDELYYIPEADFAGEIKFGVHIGVPIHPDEKDVREPPQWTVDIPAKHIREHMKDLDHSAPTRRVSCMYTVTKDHNYILDRHPNLPNVVIGGGFSGSGFKFGPAVGLILAQLAFDEPIDFVDLSAFRVDREMKQEKCRL